MLFDKIDPGFDLCVNHGAWDGSLRKTRLHLYRGAGRVPVPIVDLGSVIHEHCGGEHDAYVGVTGEIVSYGTREAEGNYMSASG